MAKFDVSGLTRIADRLDRLEKADHTPLLLDWALTMTEDNKRGILAGTNKDGFPLTPVKYRPKVGATGTKNRKKDRGLKGFGPMASGLHGNLSPAEYRQLDGPPLAPRRANSRVITNFATEIGRSGGIWWVEGFWLDVVSISGIEFLPAHFQGLGRLPVRDLRGVRPQGLAKAARQLNAWAQRLLRGM